MKTCLKCKETKENNEFYKCKKAKDGLQPLCKNCSRESARTWDKEHPDDARERGRRFRKKHQGYITEKVKQFWISNPEKRKNHDKKYRSEHKELHKLHTEKRRALKAGNGGHFNHEEYLELLRLAEYKCQRCGNINELTLDHITPLIEGGMHTKDNLQILCRSCNSKKGTKTIDFRNKVAANA